MTDLGTSGESANPDIGRSRSRRMLLRRRAFIVGAMVASAVVIAVALILIRHDLDPGSKKGSTWGAPQTTSTGLNAPSGQADESAPAGVLPGVALKNVSSQRIHSPGVILQNARVDGDLVIDAPAANVTIINVAVSGAIVINGGTPSATIDGKLVGIVPHNILLRHVDAHRLEAVGFSGLTVENSRFHDNAGTISQLARYSHRGLTWPAVGLRITGSTFTRILPVRADSSAHIEMLHLMGVENFILSNDVFDATAPDQNTWLHITAALTLESTYDGVANSGSIVRCHFLGGGYYQTYLWGAYQVDDNAFTTSVSPDGSHRSSPMYPPDAYAPRGFPHFTQQGNTLDGQPYTLPDS